MEKIKDFLEKIGFTGAANFDIKMDELTKEYYIFEINPRPGRSSYYSTFGGASIQEAYVEDLVYDRLEDKLLWLNVPMYLLNKYVTKDEIKKKVRTLKSKKEVYHTLKYKGDWSIKRKFIFYLQYARKIHYYPKYFIEKK